MVVGFTICTLGGGFCSLTRSLITTFLDREHVARLYSTIAIVEVTTSLAAGPSLAALYAAGLKFKGPWHALPFFILALLWLLGGLAVWCFGLLLKIQDKIPSGDEDRYADVANTGSLQSGTAPIDTTDTA